MNAMMYARDDSVASSTTSRRSTLHRATSPAVRRVPSAGPTREPTRLDDIIAAEELLMIDAIVVGRGGGIRLYDVVNAPSLCVLDKEACQNLPTLPYSLRQPVVIQIERQALSVSKYPTQTLVLAVPSKSIQRVVTFESKDGMGIRYCCANEFVFSFLIDDPNKRLLLHKLTAVNSVQSLPRAIEVVKLTAPSRSPSAPSVARSSSRPRTFEDCSALKTRRSKSAKPIEGSGKSSDTPAKSPEVRKLAPSMEAMRREEVLRQLAAQRREEYSQLHRPQAMPSTHDVQAALEKAARRKALEERLEEERRKRQVLKNQ